ncbi:ORF2 [Seal anellovirus 7]|uniref:ORF2 n=1 Tax=Seal anellovirus 7 TaxID=1566009 RepID=A0A0A7TWN2_9VIRU|nr:ORF2 [Seal anellovirus 7]
MSADCDTARGPDLCHPQLYKFKEAKWKQQVSKLHREFCGCNNFLDHFKWPTGTGGRSGGTGEGTEDGGAGGVHHRHTWRPFRRFGWRRRWRHPRRGSAVVRITRPKNISTLL